MYVCVYIYIYTYICKYMYIYLRIHMTGRAIRVQRRWLPAAARKLNRQDFVNNAILPPDTPLITTRIAVILHTAP